MRQGAGNLGGGLANMRLSLREGGCDLDLILMRETHKYI